MSEQTKSVAHQLMKCRQNKCVSPKTNRSKQRGDYRRIWLPVILMFTLMLAACNIATPEPAPPPAPEEAPVVKIDAGLDQSDILVDQVWVLVGYGDAANPTVVEEGTVVTAIFGGDGSLSGSAGCNNYSLSYALGDDNSLTVSGPAMTTRMACPVGMEQEQTYLAALQTAGSYRITQEGRLEIAYDSGAVYEEKLIYAPGQTPLAGAQWVLVSYGDPDDPQPVETGTTITAIFSTDDEPPAGIVSGSAGCNTYSASYSTGDNQISIEPIISTRRICPVGMEQEQAYLNALEAAETYQIIGKRLEITYDDGAGLLTFTSAHLPLEQTLWTLVSYGNPDAPRSVEDGTEITALFEQNLEDEERKLLLDRGFLDDEDEPTGTVAGSAGCNSYSATYTTDGNDIIIDEPLTTRQMCPAGMQQEQTYLAALQGADSYQILGNQLEISYGDGLGVLTYVGDRIPLENTYWALVSYGSVEQPQGLIEDTQITALFNREKNAPSGVVAGTTTCNDYKATYASSLNEIKVNLPSTSQQFCGDAIAEQEQAYFLALNAASRYRILGNALQIPYDEARQMLNFIATQPPVSPPTAVINAPTEAKVGELITFDGSQSQAANPIEIYLWDFGDGSLANAPTIGHAFGKAGVYNVTLTIIDSAGLSDSAVHQIKINEVPEVPPTAVIEGPAAAQVGQEVTFNGGNSVPGSSPIVAYSWNFGNYQVVENSPNASATTVYDKSGVYEVSLTVTDRNGLSDSTSMQILIYDTPTPPEPPTAVIEGPAEARVDERVTFSGVNSVPGGAPIVIYAWDFGNGQTTDGPYPGAATVYNEPGDYEVTLTVVDRIGRRDTTRTQIRITEEAGPLGPTAVIEGPSEAFVGEPVTFQGGNSIPGSSPIVVYAWNFDNTRAYDEGSDVSATTVYNAPGVYNPSLTVTDQNGLSDTAGMQITIKEREVEEVLPTAVINAPSQAVVGAPVTFDGSASQPGSGGYIVEYEWRFGDGDTGSGTVVEHVYSNPGGFEIVLIVTDESGRSNNTLHGILISSPEQPTPEPTEEPPPEPTEPPPEPTEPPPEPTEPPPAPTEPPPEPTVEPEGGGSLEGRTWALAQTLPETTITAEFASGTVSGSAGCNSYSGSYTSSKAAGSNTISISGLVTTEMACPDEVMAQEQAYLAALESAMSYEVNGNQLILAYAGGALTYNDQAGPQPR